MEGFSVLKWTRYISAEMGFTELTAVFVLLFVDLGGLDAVTFNPKVKPVFVFL